MARPKKSEEPAQQPTTAAKAPGRSIPVEDFMRSRDSVITGLTNLQGALQELVRAYLNHTNQILSSDTDVSTGDLLTLTNPLGTNSLLGTGVLAADQKKKRKRAPIDPHAPKRALTAYFLYMQDARAKIRADLGDKATPQEVADEGTKRWNAMPSEDKQVWRDRYKTKWAEYQHALKEYKAGLSEEGKKLQPPVDDDKNADEQLLAEAHGHLDNSDEEEEEEAEEQAQEEEEEEETESESEEDSPPPPSPPPAKRRKSAKQEAVEPAKPKASKNSKATKKEKITEKTPEKRSKRKSQVMETPKEPSPVREESKKSEKKSRRKRKSQVD